MISHYCFLNQFTFWDIFMWIHNNKQMLKVFVLFFTESFINIFQEEEIINQTILYSQESIALAPSQLGYIATLWLIFPPTINASWFSDKNLYWKENHLTSTWISTYHPFQTINSQCVLMVVITITILLWFSWRGKQNPNCECWTKTVNLISHSACWDNDCNNKNRSG